MQTVGTFNILTQEYSIQKKWVFVFVCVCFDSVRAILKVVWKERNYTITGMDQTKAPSVKISAGKDLELQSKAEILAFRS